MTAYNNTPQLTDRMRHTIRLSRRHSMADSILPSARSKESKYCLIPAGCRLVGPGRRAGQAKQEAAQTTQWALSIDRPS